MAPLKSATMSFLQQSVQKRPSNKFSLHGKELAFRLAKSSDFKEVVKLSEDIYKGRDYLPLTFHQWLQTENLHIMLGHIDEKLVCLAASFIVDDGKTSVRRAGRVLTGFRGQGVYQMLEQALEDYVRGHFPKVCRERLITYTNLSVKQMKTWRRVFEQDFLSFDVGEQPLLPPENKLEIESCTKEYFFGSIMPRPVSEKLLPNNVFVFDWCPFDAIPSNIDNILKEELDLHLFVEKCSAEVSPRSFSHGIRAQRMDAVHEWLATVYTDDPELLEAHILHQLKRACEVIQDKFTFFTFQDKTMTACARRVLEDMMQLKEVNLWDSKTVMLLYERDFTD